ncbi:hypothetical protein FisN_3Hh097 [Fistulifera solaris]|jgi:hypothetical protein|uniref:J domain-containing protein n=1 Tax=Fistulifera solaris TaxID=1519565 RepID=A0A1Z5JNL1_FISSO|nr:hypothetical protein FisN_3Hh097 [Fistulifera solaris]|eukprot:GAX15625.1 hypothetical protein FisN_3Hh097 [Fistulifera solaris]
MTTRAASAAFNLQAKQELVKLLFGKQYYRKGPLAHRMLDHSIYSYEDLRSAYLKRVQEIHPDKHHHNESQNRLERQQQFIQLQDAWNRFEELDKVMRTVQQHRENTHHNFTLFGVGCSFADSEQERHLRTQFTDQACRGWFSAGALSQDSSIDTLRNNDTVSTYEPLFVHDEEETVREADVETGRDASGTVKPIRERQQSAMEFLRRSQR